MGSGSRMARPRGAPGMRRPWSADRSRCLPPSSSGPAGPSLERRGGRGREVADILAAAWGPIARTTSSSSGRRALPASSPRSTSRRTLPRDCAGPSPAATRPSSRACVAGWAGPWTRLAAAARRRHRSGLPDGGRRRHAGDHHHGRPVHALRRAAGAGMRRGGHRLPRSHGRARVRGPDVPAAPRARGGDRRPSGPLRRVRLDPARPRRLLHREAAARGCAAERRGLRDGQGHLLRRHAGLGHDRHVTTARDPAGGGRAEEGRATARGTARPRAGRQAAP